MLKQYLNKPEVKEEYLKIIVRYIATYGTTELNVKDLSKRVVNTLLKPYYQNKFNK